MPKIIAGETLEAIFENFEVPIWFSLNTVGGIFKGTSGEMLRRTLPAIIERAPKGIPGSTP